MIKTDREADLAARVEELEDFIRRRGYRRCDIAACNCNSFHGGNAEDRLAEIREALQEADINTNGVTLIDSLKDLIARAALTSIPAVTRE
jgi:hypothetical protein